MPREFGTVASHEHIHTIQHPRMPNIRQKLLLVAGALFVIYLFYNHEAEPKATLGTDGQARSPGNHLFRQRLVAVGDLHGGMSPICYSKN
jgi:hypothetical protein